MSAQPIVLWTCTSPREVFLHVTLDSERWAHSVDGHAEVAPHLLDAKAAVESPSAIFQSATRADSYVFFNNGVRNSQGHALAVPVAVSGFNGIVSSVHFRPQNYVGKLLWKP